MQTEDVARRLRHDLRGKLNVIRLCTAAMELGPVDEALSWLSHVEKAADEAIFLLDRVDETLGGLHPVA